MKFIIHSFGWDVLLGKGLLASNFSLPHTGKLTALSVIVFGILLSNASKHLCKYRVLQGTFCSINVLSTLRKHLTTFFHLFLEQTS